MNAVSNFVGSISPDMFGNNAKSIAQNFDMGDTTFSDLLEKQINKIQQTNQFDFVNSLDFYTGINMGDFDGTLPQFGVNTNNKFGENNDMLESIKPIQESENSASVNLKDTKNMSSSEVVTFFKSLFDSKPTLADTSTSSLFEFEKKMAAGKYNQYARNIVTDLTEFVSDTMKIKS